MPRVSYNTDSLNFEAIDKVVRKFPHGSLALIEWFAAGSGYDPDNPGVELDAPEVALLLESQPSHAFQSFEGRWVVPYTCFYKGKLCVTTTYSAKSLTKKVRQNKKKE
jgi:hypothetical protein